MIRPFRSLSVLLCATGRHAVHAPRRACTRRKCLGDPPPATLRLEFFTQPMLLDTLLEFVVANARITHPQPPGQVAGCARASRSPSCRGTLSTAAFACASVITHVRHHNLTSLLVEDDIADGRARRCAEGRSADRHRVLLSTWRLCRPAGAPCPARARARARRRGTGGAPPARQRGPPRPSGRSAGPGRPRGRRWLARHPPSTIHHRGHRFAGTVSESLSDPAATPANRCRTRRGPAATFSSKCRTCTSDSATASVVDCAALRCSSR